MINSRDIVLPPEEEIHAATYRLAYAYAIDQLRDGVHPDAVRLTLYLVGVFDPASPDRKVGAEWRGADDALAGRPPSPQASVPRC